LLFLVFLVALGYVAFVAFNTGNPKYLAYPFDSNKQQCGYSPGYEGYPYIFITEYDASLIFVCVKDCPSSDTSVIDCKIGGKVQDCSNLTPYTTE